METARVFFALSFGVALAAACGGSSTAPPDGGDGSMAEASGSSSGAGSGSGGTASSSGAGTDAGRMACTIGSCPAGQVCCQMGCQAQSACGMMNNRQHCTSNAECPAAYPDCRGSMTMYCRTPNDAGMGDSGRQSDSGASDAGARDTGASDTGASDSGASDSGPFDASSDAPSAG